MQILTSLFDHVAWADVKARDAILTLPDDSPTRAQATRLYAHIAAADHVWLARLQSRTPVHAIWPELSLDAAASLATESVAGLRAIAMREEDDLEEMVEYQNSTGHPFRSRIVDMLTHVAMHGSYHRGQIALLVRQGDGTPSLTDYIAYARVAQVIP